MICLIKKRMFGTLICITISLLVLGTFYLYAKFGGAGAVDKGIPPDGDKITEKGATKFSPAAWELISMGSALTDSTLDCSQEENAPQHSNYSVKVQHTGLLPVALKVKFHIDRTGVASVNGETTCKYLHLWIRITDIPAFTSDLALWIVLEDITGNQIEAYRPLLREEVEDKWKEMHVTMKFLGIGMYEEPNELPWIWVQKTGTTFDWTQIQKIYFEVSQGGLVNPHKGLVGITFYIDGLMFVED